LLRLTIRLLGQFRVELADGEAVSFPTQSTAMILALLALRPGRPMNRATLAQWLWPDHDAQRGAANLRQALWRLRKALGDASDVVTIRRDEIWLQSDPAIWIDLTAFQTCGDPQIVQGGLLEGWDEEWVLRERTAFTEEFLLSLTRTASAALQAGRPDDALPPARRLVAEDPLREEGHRLIMSAHLALGQPAAALQQYNACREVLAQELGVEPAPETRSLALQVRASFELGARPAPVASPDTPALVGRTRELAQLLGAPGQALVTGEPGIGKSRLVREALRTLEQDGTQVLSVACYDGPTPPPYQLLADLVRGIGAATLGKLPPGLRAGLGALLPELGPAPAISLSNARSRTIAAVSELLRLVATARPLVVALDDLQWSDPASIDALELIWPRLNSDRVRLIATCRTDALVDREDIGQWVERQSNAGRLAAIHLEPLNAAQTVELAEQTAPGTGVYYARWLQHETAGNPLFIIEHVRATLHLPASPPAALPESIQRLLRARLSALTPEARELLRAAAVLGPVFSLAHLRAMAALPQEAFLNLFDELLQRGLLQEDGSGARFVHGRLREVALADITRTRLLTLHGSAARVVPDPALSAYHAEQAEEWALAAQKLRVAAERVYRLGAHAEAVSLYSRALEAVRRVAGAEGEEAAILVGRDMANAALAAHDQRSADIDRAIRLAEKARDVGLVVRARIRRADLLVSQGFWEAAQSEIRRLNLFKRSPFALV
jgi:DNA-binding SARP family transcriptional activator